MKPNKKQRHSIYKKAFTRMESHYSKEYPLSYGLCFFISKSIEYSSFSNPYKELQDYLEIYECRPDGFRKNDYFFSCNPEEGLFQRLVILDRAITLTKS